VAGRTMHAVERDFEDDLGRDLAHRAPTLRSCPSGARESAWPGQRALRSLRGERHSLQSDHRRWKRQRRAPRRPELHHLTKSSSPRSRVCFATSPKMRTDRAPAALIGRCPTDSTPPSREP
jgi:hypothetical protein